MCCGQERHRILRESANDVVRFVKKSTGMRLEGGMAHLILAVTSRCINEGCVCWAEVVRIITGDTHV